MKFLKIILLLLFSQFTFGQNPYYYSIDKTNGLPSNSVYDIFQDSKGFMWFATGKGLCRYDGSVFKTFTSDTQTSKSGSGINEDSFGRNKLFHGSSNRNARIIPIRSAFFGIRKSSSQTFQCEWSVHQDTNESGEQSIPDIQVDTNIDRNPQYSMT